VGWFDWLGLGSKEPVPTPVTPDTDGLSGICVAPDRVRVGTGPSPDPDQTGTGPEPGLGEIEDREPEEHAQLLLAYQQKRKRFGWKSSSEIRRVYPFVVAEARVRPIGINRVLHALGGEGGITKKRRRKEYADTGELQNPNEYFIPKPKAAKVTSIDRRQAS
jgi:hypothetical protein